MEIIKINRTFRSIVYCTRTDIRVRPMIKFTEVLQGAQPEEVMCVAYRRNNYAQNSLKNHTPGYVIFGQKCRVVRHWFTFVKTRS